MNRQRAQVFIATTHGLVQVESIVRLKDPKLDSVITVGSSSQLAGISSDYQNFVAKPQGIVSDLFIGEAYRLNLSKGIDQGESWQLGVFLAHYLFENNCFSNGTPTNNSHSNDAAVDDIIFIATGRIDTLHYRVLPIGELAKKCLHANPHIAQWQAKQLQICFLAPSQNFRQPIPSTLMNLTPVTHLGELFNLCKLYGLATKELVFSNTVDASTRGQIEIIHDVDEVNDVNEAVTVEEHVISGELLKRDHELDSTANVPRARNFIVRRIPLIIYILIITTFIWSATSLIGSLFSGEDLISLNNNKDVMASNTTSEYIMVGGISENRAQCLLADNIIIRNGVLGHSTQSTAIDLHKLCDLFVITGREINGLWLVSDTKAIITLNAHDIDKLRLKEEGVNLTTHILKQSDQLKQWSVPLPKNESQSRTFTLLAFSQLPDAADEQSLEKYLYEIYLQGKSHTINDLQHWINNTQSKNKVFMIEQELIIYR